jgi:NodT family efflux transporter outer membrane factor (OMF) lipoprotein
MCTSGNSSAPVSETAGSAQAMRPFQSSFCRGACLLVILAMLAACAVGPNFVRPSSPAVDRYTVEPLLAATVAADNQAQRFTSGAALTADWWRLFQSAELDAVVRQALADNPTLQAAAASLRQSQHQLRAGYGVFFPQAGAELDAIRERIVPLEEGLQAQPQVFNLVTLSGTISYALDIFGGERRMVEGLKAQVDYQRYASQAAYLTLSANVVNTIIARAAYVAEVRVTEQLIALQRQQLKSTEVEVRAGTAPYSDVLSLRSLIAANQATLAPLKQQISHTEDLLATLEGVTPAKATLPEIELTGLSLPVELPVSLPSDLARQRPDILSSEAQLHAASANIGVATAAMFPSVSLSATYGGAGSSFGNLSAASGRFWSIGPSATVPIFQGGRLWYGRKAAIDAYQVAQATYRQTVLDAFAQVADSLKALEHDAQALQAEVDAQRAAGEALALLQVSYHAGLVAYLDVWAADVQFHEATIGYLQAVAQRYQDTVALFVALGGGWWNSPRHGDPSEAP